MRWSTILPVAFVCSFGPVQVTLGQNTRTVGVESVVNAYTPGGQSRPDVASDAEGGFVVVWDSADQDGSSLGIFARRFDVAETALSTEFQVNVHTVGLQFVPAAAMTGQGAFVVAWVSNDQDGDGTGAFARLFDASGVAVGGEIQVSIRTEGNQLEPSLAIDDEGFLVVWRDDGVSGASQIFSRRFDSSGVAQAGEFQVNTITSNDQRRPRTAPAPDGSFVVVWEDNETYPALRLRRLDADGSPLSIEFSVSDSVFDVTDRAELAVDGDGDILVSWNSFGRDGSENGVFARCFDAALSPLGKPFQVSAFTVLDQENARVAANRDGSFLVTWAGRGESGGLNDVFVQPVTVNCHELTGVFMGAGTVPAVAAASGRDFVVVRAAGGDIAARRVAVGQDGIDGGSSSIDVDGNGEREPLTDGVLMLRFLFGFTGPTLVFGAVADDCTRCEAEEIEAYLETL